MPLLSLPLELLYEILKDAEFDLILNPTPHNRGTITIRSVASTCKLLRSIAIRYIYDTVRVTRLRDLEALPAIFASRQDIPDSVRHLAFGFPVDSVTKANLWPLKDIARSSIDCYRQILQSCNNISTLYIEAGARYSSSKCRIDSYGQHVDGISSLLEHINPEAAPKIDRLIIERFDLKKMFSHFTKLDNLCNLRVLWLMACDGSLGNPLASWKRSPKLFPNLPSVRDLRIQLQLPTLSDEAETALGEHIALAIPNVNTLALETSMHCIYGALTTYSKKSTNIKELELGPHSPKRLETSPNLSGIHLCDAIASLSPRLVNFQVCLGRRNWQSTLPLCHKMFDGEWSHLQDLSYSGYASTCDGIDRGRLQENLDRIANSRPTAELSICCSTRLLYKPADSRTYYVADTNTFSSFDNDQESFEPIIWISNHEDDDDDEEWD